MFLHKNSYCPKKFENFENFEIWVVTAQVVVIGVGCMRLFFEIRRVQFFCIPFYISRQEMTFFSPKSDTKNIARFFIEPI